MKHNAAKDAVTTRPQTLIPLLPPFAPQQRVRHLNAAQRWFQTSNSWKTLLPKVRLSCYECNHYSPGVIRRLLKVFVGVLVWFENLVLLLVMA